jgi:hypothetical protein
MAARMKMAFFWDMTSCTLVHSSLLSEGRCCVHIQRLVFNILKPKG